ncbi:hypothetical protein [Desulfurispora thermophila]|uniref:hypothetical protein n=1 Tax=Desulfurispora thermophila TaxID=265470 RepID=UPI000370F0A0|nr:hypothetical protein [Desulfurispora thermophila]
MSRAIREGASYSQKDVVDFLTEFSSFKDRVEKKFKEVAKELSGKHNEHELWVNLYLISTDYAEELANRKNKSAESQMQKVS